MSTGLLRKIRIKNPKGLHTKTSTMVAKLVQTFQSDVWITLDGRTADARSIMSLLTLGALEGRELEISVQGVDQDEAMAALEKMIEDGFGEMNV